MRAPDSWRWIWVVAIAVFGIGEMLMAGTFFLLPFAIGAAVAALAAWLDANLVLQWSLFLAISVISFMALIPARKRLDQRHLTEGIGARRMIGKEGIVVGAIPDGPGEAGEVRVDAEIWRAVSEDSKKLDDGSRVRVVEVEGTRLIVKAIAGDEDHSNS